MCIIWVLVAPPLKVGQLDGGSLRPGSNCVPSPGDGVQAANRETLQTVYDPSAYTSSQEYSLPALLALIADKMTN